MKPYKDLKLSQGSDKWKKWRRNRGIGGSEIATVLATDSKDLADLIYTPPIKLYLDKIGENVQQFTGNVPSMEGQFQEHAIVERFKYWDLERPDALGMHKNREAGIVLNRVWNINTVFWNPEYEWLFYSPDAVLLVEGERRAILESKLTTSMETSRYKNRLNPAFYLQIQMGLMITGLPIGYALILIDGQWFDVVPVHPDQAVFDWIKSISARFWASVLKARKIKIEYGIENYFAIDPMSFDEGKREGIKKLEMLEPMLTGNEREIEFIKEMIVPLPERVERQGTIEEQLMCMSYHKVNENLRDLQKEKNVLYSNMLKAMGGSNVVNFDHGGYYSYLPDKNGKRSLHVSSKLK